MWINFDDVIKYIHCVSKKTWTATINTSLSLPILYRAHLSIIVHYRNYFWH